MRKFMITVNGASYEVDVEEIGGAPTAAPVRPAAPVAPVAPAAPVAGEAVKAPMPGNILDVKVKAGDSVTKGQTLVVLEAMKMENEIPAPHDGKVLQVIVTKGSTVEAGATMVVLG